MPTAVSSALSTSSDDGEVVTVSKKMNTSPISTPVPVLRETSSGSSSRNVVPPDPDSVAFASNASDTKLYAFTIISSVLPFTFALIAINVACLLPPTL